MKKTFFDHRSVEAGSLALEIGCFRPFLPSWLPYFNPGPGFLSFLRFLLCLKIGAGSWPPKERQNYQTNPILKTTPPAILVSCEGQHD
jgi:hypothetical protein